MGQVAEQRTKRRKLKYPTWEHPKGSGIKIAEIPNRTGGTTYGVSYQVRIPAKLLGKVGQREMPQRPTRAEAERLAEDRYIALKRHGTEFAKIPAKAQQLAATAWSILEEHNQQTRLSLNLIDVVRAGIQALSPTGGLRTFAEVAAEMRASKKARLEASDLDAQTERNFRQRSLRLEQTGLGEKLVSQIVGPDVERALTSLRTLDGEKLSQRSILNYRRILAEIFRHALAKRYTPTNPLDHLAKEDLKRLGGEKQESRGGSISVLTPAQARKLLHAALELNEPGMLATLVLRLYCGLRTGEVSLVDWSEVRWLDNRPVVILPAEKTKTGAAREVTIPANALKWLEICNPPQEGRVDPLSPKTYAKRFGRIARQAGLGKEDAKGNWLSDWDINVTRHSFGSYHYALHDNAPLTSKEMGHINNPRQLFTNYRRLVTKEQAEEYFAILPPEVGGNVTAFPQAASGSR
jgi:integrase